jgi:hypothetical protein
MIKKFNYRTKLTSFALLLFGLQAMAVSPEDSLRLSEPDNFDGLELLEPYLDTKDIFILGENHTYLESNTKMWVKTFKYLHQKAGVRTIVVEYGEASVYLVNQYIKTGDKKYRDIIKNYAFPEYADAYDELQSYYESCDSSEKFEVIGIDLERGVHGGVKLLSLLLPEDQTPHDSIGLHVESIFGLTTYQDIVIFDKLEKEREKDDDDITTIRKLLNNYYNKYSVKNTLKRVVENFNKFPEHYKSLVGEEDFPLFKRTVNNIETLQQWNVLEEEDAIQDYNYRERFMYNNFINLIQTRGGKYFGQFGRCHAAQDLVEKNSCEWYYFKSLANRLKTSDKVDLEDRIFSMGILYRSDDYSRELWEDAADAIEEEFEEVNANTVVLVDPTDNDELSDFFDDKFDLLAFNKNVPDSDHPYVDTDDLIGALEDDMKFKLLFSVNTTNIDLAPFNAAFDNHLGFNFENVMNGFSVSVVTTTNKWFASRSDFAWFSPQQRDLLNTTQNTVAEISGFGFSSHNMGNLGGNISFMDIMGGLGFSYYQLNADFTRFEENTTINSPSVDRGFLGTESVSRYTNPALTFDLVGQFDVDLKWLTFGVFAVQRFDVSKKEWRIDEIISNGPETSLRGLQIGYHIGFNF